MQFDLAGKTYSLHRLSAFEQCDLARRVAPLLPLVVPAFQAITAGRDAPVAPSDVAAEMVAGLHPVFAALGAMDEKDFNALLRTALKSVEVRDGSRGEFHKIIDGGTLMRDDLPDETLLILVVRSCVFNLRPTIPPSEIMAIFSDSGAE